MRCLFYEHTEQREREGDDEFVNTILASHPPTSLSSTWRPRYRKYVAARYYQTWLFSIRQRYAHRVFTRDPTDFKTLESLTEF